MHFDFWKRESEANVDAEQVFIGICVVTEDALAAFALPDPGSDFNQDWYYWAARNTRATENDSLVSWDADIRSARRLRGGYRLVMIVEAPASNVNDIAISPSMRNLWVQQA